MLFLSTFPSLRITWNGKPVPGTGKPAALLVYLVLSPGQQRREALTELFWPGLEADAARQNLRQTVFLLRNTLLGYTGHAFIESHRQYLCFDTASPHYVDALELGASLQHCATGAPNEFAASLERMTELAALYKGQLLAGFELPDCPEFDDWLQVKRESLHRRALDLLVRLADCHERQNNFRAAISFTQRYTELEPWSEEGCRRAMRLYAQDGQHEAALRQYEVCARELERDLGVLPGAETQSLLARVQRHEFSPVAPTAVAIAQPMEERRLVTVMYCELHVFGIDDPENAMELLSTPQSRCLEIVQKFSGHVVQAHGGGLLAYFGYPLALENSALFAVRAAWAVAAEATPELEIRAGVHSGLIVTGGDTNIPDPIGMTSSIAIRLREQAGNGEVIVSEEAQKRVAGYFNFTNLGSSKLRGIPQARLAFKVEGMSGASHRLAAATSLTPFAGREDALATLRKTWVQTRRGEFHALLVSGDAGIGKSRLLRALTDLLDGGSGFVRELRCFPETRHSPLHPVIALYESLCGFTIDDTSETKLAKLQNFLRMRAPQFAEPGLPLLAHMLSLPLDSPALHNSTPEKLKATTHKLLVDLLYVLAAHRPVLLVVEDLHWADNSTLDFLAQLLAKRAPAPILVLMTARPEWKTDWSELEVIKLKPLSDSVISHLVRSLDATISSDRVARIVARADGIPLFAEELAALAQEGDLPTNLHDLLVTRLDGLGTERIVAQLAATIGREFDLDFLGRTSNLAASQLKQAVGKLQSSGLVQPLMDGHFQFKHALVQEAAYQSQTKNARQSAHLRVAEVLQDGYRNIAELQPEVLAQHWGAAGETIRAIHYWFAAGQRAYDNHAHHEAVSHYEAGLKLIQQLRPGIARDKLEFPLLVNLARSEQVVSGYGQRSSAELLQRAIVLQERGAGNAQDVFNALWGLWEGAGSRTGHHEAIQLAQRLLGIARNENNRALLQQAHYALGNSLFWTGELTQSRSHLEQSVALEAPNTQKPTRDCYGRYMRISATLYLAWVLWLQGLTESAFAHLDEAHAIAQDYDDPRAPGVVLIISLVLHRWQGNLVEVTRLNRDAFDLMTRHPVMMIEAWRLSASGWATVLQGDADGIVLLEQSIEAMRRIMKGVAVMILIPYIEALLHTDNAAKALEIADEARQQAEEKHDFHFLSELHRLKGECLSRLGNIEGARTCFETALKVSRAQGAVALELRAKNSAKLLAAGH